MECNPIPLFIFCGIIWFFYGIWRLGYKAGQRKEHEWQRMEKILAQIPEEN